MKAKFVTTEKAAEMLGCDVSHVRRLVRRGKLFAMKQETKFGFEWHVEEASVKAYDAELRRKEKHHILRGWPRGKKKKV